MDNRRLPADLGMSAGRSGPVHGLCVASAPRRSRCPKTTRSRRGYWRTRTGTKVPEGQVLEWLSEFIATPDGQAYGYRKLTTWLRREHQLVINKKSVYRLLAEADLLQGRRFSAPKDRPIRRLAANRTITSPNQLWEMDLKYAYIAGQDRFFYLCGVIDVFDRSILGYHIGWTCTVTQALRALQAAWPP